MKRFINQLLLLIVVSISFFSMSSYADDFDENEGTTCLKKREIIETKIGHAARGSYQEAGLKQALANLNQHCNDRNLEAKYKEKIAEKRDKVAKAERKLSESQLKGDSKKIIQKEEKLRKAKAELNFAETKLTQFYSDLPH